MQKIHDIEQSVANLSPHELAIFRAWYHNFDADRWDAQFETDVSMGKLDRLAQDALQEFAQGHCKEL